MRQTNELDHIRLARLRSQDTDGKVKESQFSSVGASVGDKPLETGSGVLSGTERCESSARAYGGRNDDM